MTKPQSFLNFFTAINCIDLLVLLGLLTNIEMTDFPALSSNLTIKILPFHKPKA